MVVVFDECGRTLSTKVERQNFRALCKSSAYIIFNCNTTVSVEPADILANKSNISRLISLLPHIFKPEGLEMRHAEADADTLIVNTAVVTAKAGLPVSAVAICTNNFVMLLNRTERGTNI